MDDIDQSTAVDVYWAIVMEHLLCKYEIKTVSSQLCQVAKNSLARQSHTNDKAIPIKISIDFQFK